MNSSTAKKRARELQAITGMPYQAAHRAVTEGNEFQAFIRSGYTLGDFVTPREQRIWLQVNSGELRCAEDRHWMPTEDLGQCVGCGVPMATFWDHEGDEHEAPIDEDEFLERCAKVGTYYNWAPPMAMLDGITQAEYFRRYWRPVWTEDDAPAHTWTSRWPPGTQIRSVCLPTLVRWNSPWRTWTSCAWSMSSRSRIGTPAPKQSVSVSWRFGRSAAARSPGTRARRGMAPTRTPTNSVQKGSSTCTSAWPSSAGGISRPRRRSSTGSGSPAPAGRRSPTRPWPDPHTPVPAAGNESGHPGRRWRDEPGMSEKYSSPARSGLGTRKCRETFWRRSIRGAHERSTENCTR